jgi:hypothetical protein
MKNDHILTMTSLLAIILMSLHFTDDVVRGIEPGGLKNLGGVLILVVWLYTTLVLARRRWCYMILLVASLFAALMPVLHMSGKGVGGEFAASSGAFFSIWLLIALGVTGTFSLVLSVRGLWSLRAKAREG